MAKSKLQKLNEQASKTDGIIKVHEAGIAYAKGQMMESAGKLANEAGKVIAEASRVEAKVMVLLAKYGA